MQKQKQKQQQQQQQQQFPSNAIQLTTSNRLRSASKNRLHQRLIRMNNDIRTWSNPPNEITSSRKYPRMRQML
jgi:transcription initiation factor TFIID subunit TAF12